MYKAAIASKKLAVRLKNEAGKATMNGNRTCRKEKEENALQKRRRKIKKKGKIKGLFFYYKG